MDELAPVLVLGARGMLGQDLVAELARRGQSVLTPDRSEFDITNLESIARIALGDLGPLGGVINAAAYTAVDRAETEEALAFDVNGLSVAYLGRACADAKVPLLHVSTDFVFDGEATAPYLEDAPTRPLSAYGRSKLHGEQALAGNPFTKVVRTAWLFGPTGRCFPRTMVERFRAGASLKVVSDQFGTPSYTADVARIVVDLWEKNAFPGIYHAAGPEVTTWHDFAERSILAATGTRPSLPAITTEEYPVPAVRPKYSALGDSRLANLGIAPHRPLDDALTDWVRRADL